MNIFLYLGLLFLLGVNFIGCVRYLDRSTHVLYSKPQLISAKSYIPNGIGFAQEFVFERSTLAHDQLNLTSWGGLNEVIWNTNSKWQQINLNARLNNSYIWIFVIAEQNKRIGFRLSKHHLFESGYYEMSADKLFLKNEKIGELPSTQNLQIQINYTNSKLSLKINDKLYFDKATQLPNQLVSFRSSLSGDVVVDDLVMKNTDGSVYTENFSPKTQKINWLISGTFQIIFSLILFVLIRRSELAIQTLSGAMLIISTICVFWTWLDKSKISEHYYNISSFSWNNPFKSSNDMALEIIRKRSLKFIYDLLQQKNNSFILEFKNYTYNFLIPSNTSEIPDFAKLVFKPNGLESNLPKTRKKFIDQAGNVSLIDDFSDLSKDKNQHQKIVLIGSSQIFGGGAESIENIFSSQVVEKIRKCSKKSVSSVNISSPGDKIEYFLKTYKDLLSFWKPTLTIISLGSNEHDLEQFYQLTQEMIILGKDVGAQTVLMKESNTLEAGPNNFASKNAVFDKLAAEYKLTVLDLDSFINSNKVYDQGILWIDRAHFDRAGHNLSADWLFDELKKRKLVSCQ